MMKALIVEDESMARMRLVKILEASFPNVEVVAQTDSITGTLDYLRRSGDPDIIFMDVELSDGDCFEVFRQRDVRSKVIMTTAYDSYALKAFEAGSVDYLLKPISVSALQRAIGRCEAFFDASASSASASSTASAPPPRIYKFGCGPHYGIGERRETLEEAYARQGRGAVCASGTRLNSVLPVGRQV